MADEASAAAIARVWERGSSTKGEAYRQGRWAALDELRRLTGHRRIGHARTVSWPVDDDGEPKDVGRDDPELVAADDRLRIYVWAADQPDRTRRIVAAILNGATFQEAAEAEGVSPSRVSQLLRRPSTGRVDREG